MCYGVYHCDLVFDDGARCFHMVHGHNSDEFTTLICLTIGEENPSPIEEGCVMAGFDFLFYVASLYLLSSLGISTGNPSMLFAS